MDAEDDQVTAAAADADVVHVGDRAELAHLTDFTDLTDVALRSVREPAEGMFLAEGERTIRRAIEAGYAPRAVLTSERWRAGLAPALATARARGQDPTVYVATDDVVREITGYRVHRGALASFERRALPTVADLVAIACTVVVLEDLVDSTNVGRKMRGAPSTEVKPRRSRIAVLENLVDHANVGAVFRSAAALGVDAVLVTPSCADPLYRRSIKVSMGAVFQVPWARIDPWPDGIHMLQDAGYVVAGMTLGSGAMPLDELIAEDHERLALLFGTEGHGITPQVDRRLDRRVTIPMMHGVDSLNVAASSAVVFYATK